MPIYEYRCRQCRKRFNRFLMSFSAAASYVPQCPHCGSRDAQRLVSRVYSLRGSSDNADDASPGDDFLDDIDENDPSSMGRAMRRMSEESGEDLGPEVNEVIQRLEKGQDPEQIERDLPDLGGDTSTAAGDDSEV
ncbi:MAG: FmdB family zinc ribbon protein [Anaerolineae bacterium]